MQCARNSHKNVKKKKKKLTKFKKYYITHEQSFIIAFKLKS